MWIGMSKFSSKIPPPKKSLNLTWQGMEPAPSLEAKAQEARGEANGLLKSVIVNWIWLNMHLIFPTPFFGNLSNGTYFYLQYMKIRILNIFYLSNFIVRQMNIISILFNDLRMGCLLKECLSSFIYLITRISQNHFLFAWFF